MFLNILWLSQDVKSLLLSWQGQKVGSRSKLIWKTIPLYVMWNIWLERNKRCFQGEKHVSFVKYSVYRGGIRTRFSMHPVKHK